MRHAKIAKYSDDQILEEMYAHCFNYSNYAIEQGYTKTNLKPYIEKALKDNRKKNLRMDLSTGTIRDNDGHLSSFNNVNDWVEADPIDKDPLYHFAHQIKCDAVRYYNNYRFNL